MGFRRACVLTPTVFAFLSGNLCRLVISSPGGYVGLTLDLGAFGLGNGLPPLDLVETMQID